MPKPPAVVKSLYVYSEHVYNIRPIFRAVIQMYALDHHDRINELSTVELAYELDVACCQGLRSHASL